MKDKKILYSKLAGRIVEKCESRTAFSKAVGMTVASISAKLLGVNGFSQKDIIRWAEVLEIPENEYYDYFFMPIKFNS